MEVERVLRVEHRWYRGPRGVKLGPYVWSHRRKHPRSDKVGGWMVVGPSGGGPTPEGDRGIGYGIWGPWGREWGRRGGACLVCGFADRRQLGWWWGPNTQRSLAEHGFVLAEYEVPATRVYRGERQVVFPARHARRVAVHSLAA